MAPTFVFFGALLVATCAEEIRIKVQPSPPDERDSLIWFNKTSFDSWSNQLDNFIEVYRNPELTAGRPEAEVSCDWGSPPPPGKVCHINPETFAPCVTTNYFGYRRLAPCIFLQFFPEKGWRPKFYGDLKTLPTSMPRNLKNYIIDKSVEPYTWETVWVSCDGENPADKELIGPVRYIPGPGVPAYHFPYTGQKGYLPPLVAVQFEMPQTGIVISIECKTWAANIKPHKDKLIGTVKFQLMIDV
ncbi:sodium/potassium-transporting ATPase subunit beta-2-like [Macrosteles quadrilineatus]|nr:sodium/potassium-transporting ATPase subunit beta-2-like [Macrosteles quadrilineatus]